MTFAYTILNSLEETTCTRCGKPLAVGDPAFRGPAGDPSVGCCPDHVGGQQVANIIGEQLELFP